MITSVQNEQVKGWRRLHRRKYRYERKQFLIEGFHLIEAAIRTNQAIETIIVAEGVTPPSEMTHADIVTVSERVFQAISQTETPQGIAAVVQMQEVKPTHHQYVLLIDAIQDPGNLGTIIRTADAAGFSKIILGKGTVDLYNDKVIRATQGSLFHLPIVQADLAKAIPSLQAEGFSVWATTLEGADNYRDIPVGEKTAMILGNEGRGIEETYVNLANELVKIPIFGQAESLNVGIAAGVLMYYIRN